MQHLFLEKGEFFPRPVVIDHGFISIPVISKKKRERKNSHIKALSIDIL